MKQDEKGGKRSAGEVGESKHAGRLLGRAPDTSPYDAGKGWAVRLSKKTGTGTRRLTRPMRGASWSV